MIKLEAANEMPRSASFLGLAAGPMMRSSTRPIVSDRDDLRRLPGKGKKRKQPKNTHHHVQVHLYGNSRHHRLFSHLLIHFPPKAIIAHPAPIALREARGITQTM